MEMKALGRAVGVVAAIGIVLLSQPIGETAGRALAAEPEKTAKAEKSIPSSGDSFGKSLMERETLTDNWFSLGEKLSEQGVTISLGLTQVYQLNLDSSGGTATHRHAGRYTGSYDLEFEFDLEKLFKLPGGLVYAAAEGSWSDGLDESSIGSLFGVNGDAGGCRPIDLTALYYEQSLLDGRLVFRIGKIDLSGGFECKGCPAAFDANAFANDETSQFLNGALANNPTIPMPDNGLGLAVFAEPIDRWYVAFGMQDAQSDARETGFRTAFHDEDYFFFIWETGVTPLIPSANGPMRGAYRIGLWYDPQDKERFDETGSKRDDVGFYLSFDQVVLKENADEEDSQGLGLFARYGYAHQDVNEIRCFWSVGAQYQGLIAGRDDDVLGLGAAQGRLSRECADFTRSHETVIEVYYNAQVTPWLNFGPSLQYVFNPGGDKTIGDATVLGFRLQLTF